MSQTVPDHLAKHSHRKVRLVAKEDGPHAEQLFREAMGDRKHWNVPDWKAVLVTLDACNDTVEMWRLYQ